jgi:hypothetical protein
LLVEAVLVKEIILPAAPLFGSKENTEVRRAQRDHRLRYYIPLAQNVFNGLYYIERTIFRQEDVVRRYMQLIDGALGSSHRPEDRDTVHGIIGISPDKWPISVSY